jgi:hypothetical protein
MTVSIKQSPDTAKDSIARVVLMPATFIRDQTDTRCVALAHVSGRLTAYSGMTRFGRCGGYFRIGDYSTATKER